MSLRLKLVVCAALLLVCTALPAQKISDIRPQGYLTDLAQVIDPATKAKIEALCTEVQQKTGSQIAVVTARSLENQSVEDYAADLYQHLGVGSKAQNNGVLLLLVPQERRYRVEVGYGLEPVINDARAGDVGRAMIPDLKRGDYSGAVLQGVTLLAQMIAADKHVQLTGVPALGTRRQFVNTGFPWWLKLLGFLVFFWVIRAISGFGRRGGPGPAGGRAALPPVIFMPPMGGSSWGGGGFGGSSGGFSGGGGFGGFGGGMSGGGGASGSW